MKRLGFKNLSSLVISGLIVGACSPVAPSVSKLSNAAAEKTNTTDGSSPMNNIGTSGSLTSHTSTTSDGAMQRTQVETRDQFSQSWNLVRDVKPSMRLENAVVDDFARDGKASFFSNSDRVKGQEAALSATKTDIHLVMHADQATITKEQMDKMHVVLTWVPVSASNKEAHWELTLEAPKSDAVKDMADYQKMLDLLRANLAAVAVTFQAD